MRPVTFPLPGRGVWGLAVLVCFAVLASACVAGPLVIEPGGGDAGDGSSTGDGSQQRPDGSGADVLRDGNGMDAGGCVTDDDCASTPATPFCDRNAQVCRACLSNPNTCGARNYCDSAYRCVPGCLSDDDCRSGADGGVDGAAAGGLRCDRPTHRCVGCLGDLDCPSPLVCRDNACVMGCSDARPCPGTLACCDGTCIDLLDDGMHCGTCTHACGGSESCCGGICYPLQTDPRHCGACNTRCAVPNAVAGCALGACSVGSCAPGFGDCDGNAANGCEAPLTSDPNHCGTCATACTAGPHTNSQCTAGICSSTCAPGYLHCSSNPMDGCESDARTDPNNCGACGHVCTSAHATGGCVSGVCTIASCNAGYSDCNLQAADGCEAATQTDPVNCGACFNVCPSGPYSRAQCALGACSVSCLAGHGDCNAMASDGCESDFATDVNHCGGCATRCTAGSNAVAQCNMGSCAYACTGTFRDCDGMASNGCEVDVLSSLSNCGSCGTACSTPHGTPSCNLGACTLSSCSAGYANCNGVVSDGCETPTTADPLNCGACFSVCSAPPFATATCASSTCGFACVAGHGNCDGSAANGCEANFATDPLHCGSCAGACPTPANAVATCTTGTCGFVCLPGFRDCDGVASNGCEANLLTSATHCGACGSSCNPAHATGACMAGVCTITACASGFANCNGGVSDGCETSTGTVSNCGACLAACPSGANGTATCVANSCGLTCGAGFGNCNGVAGDGCESTLANDPLNCGACGMACTAYPNTTATCSGSACGFICQAGFANCNSVAADGCEVSVRTDANNCGGCGLRCTVANGTPGCSATGCTVASCNAGFADCNGLVADGCETPTTSNSSNCGGCGVVCTGGQVCVSSVCTLVNPFPSTGAEGDFAPVANTVLAPGLHNFRNISVPAGVTVSTNGSGLLDLRATGTVVISGVIDVSGGNGGNGVRVASGGAGGGGGGATGQRVTAASGVPGTGGIGGQMPSGTNGGSGCGASATGGSYGGGSGTEGTTTLGGGGGGGPAGGGGGLVDVVCIAGSGGGGTPPGAGGQANGPPYDGVPGQSGPDLCGGLVAGGGGGSIGLVAFNDLQVATTFYPGSGGGGGSGSYGTGLSGASGGGGGGGGALRLASPLSITVNSTGALRANGGNGGGGNPQPAATCFGAEAGAGGGGGSGGTVYLAAPTVTVAGVVSAVGGAGGARGTGATGGDGGAGGLGRIRISATQASCNLTGTFTPALRSGCAVNAMGGFTYVNSYPR